MPGCSHLHNISFSQHGTLENAHYPIAESISFTQQQMGASIYDFTGAVLNEIAQYSGLSIFLSSVLAFAGKKILLICCNSFDYSPRHTEWFLY